MDVTKLNPIDGDCVRAVIEIPFGTVGAKYEFDEGAGCFVLDRIFNTPVHYPCAYGFVPNTKCGDGDALDVLIVCSVSLPMGVVVDARPIGLLSMSDDKGQDEKLLAVADGDPVFGHAKEHGDLPVLSEQISYFFKRYKDLDSDKWSEVVGWEGADSAWRALKKCVL